MSRLNWQFDNQLVFNGVESRFCLVWVNFLWQLNIELVNSRNTEQQFSLKKRTTKILSTIFFEI